MDDIAVDLVTQYSLSGHPLDSTDCVLPRINDEFLDCSIYLYASVIEAQSGSRTGGSGFILALPIQNLTGVKLLVAVTNRHVIEDGFTVIRLNRKDGRADEIDKTEKDWFWLEDGTDLAITPLPAKEDIHQFRALPKNAIFRKEAFEKYNIGVGDELFLVGRFVGHDGKQTNVPTARFGYVAQWPTRPLEDKRGRQQETFLCEVHSIGGFSGSPVFVHIPPLSLRPERERKLSAEFLPPALVGVDWCHTLTQEPLRDAGGNEMPGRVHVNSHTGLMGVIPSWKLLELLEGDRMKQIIEVATRVYLERQRPSTETDVAIVPASPDELAEDAPGSRPESDNPEHREDFNRLLNEAARKP